MPKAKVYDPFGGGVMTDEEAAQEELSQPQEQPAEQPAAETPPEAAKSPEPQQQAEPPKPEENRIPLARFNEINEQRKAAEAERNELRERWARLDERTKQVRESQQAVQEAAKAPQRPDPEIDAVGAQLWDFEHKIKGLEEQLAQRDQQFQQFQQAQGVESASNWVLQDTGRFTQQVHADYPQAARHAWDWRARMHQAAGLTPEQSNTLVQKELEFYAGVIRQNGGSIAQWVWDLAQSTGYVSPANQQVAANGAVQLPVQQVAQPVNRLPQLQAGQRATGLSGMGGTQGANTPYRDFTPAQIAELSEAEWSRLMANPQTRRELTYALSRAEGVSEQEAGRIYRA